MGACDPESEPTDLPPCGPFGEPQYDDEPEPPPSGWVWNRYEREWEPPTNG